MSEGGHRAFVVSWDRAGVEVDLDDGEVCEAVVARAWRCTCGTQGAVRSVDSRYYRPSGDVEGRLRAARVRRSDREGHAALLADHGSVLGSEAVTGRGTAVGAAPDEADARGTAPSTGTVRAGAEVAASGPGYSSGAAAADGPSAAGFPPVRSARAERARRRHAQALESVASEGPPGPRSHPTDPTDPTHSLPAPTTAAVRGRAVSGSPAEDIAGCAARAARARGELAAAEDGLRDAVLRGRASGLSWRAIAAAAGVDHRDARERWTSASAADTAF